MLKNFEKLYRAKGGVAGTVIHIGAGLCSELPYYARLNFENIQLVEANTNLATRLAEKVEKTSEVKISQLPLPIKKELLNFTIRATLDLIRLKNPPLLKNTSQI